VLALPREPKRRSMKRAKIRPRRQEMLPEYDFTDAVRGKYYERFRQGSNIVVLDPDVSEAFPTSASVNSALRSLAAVARTSVVPRASTRATRLRRGTRSAQAAKTSRRRARG
jgi:hypothetical protein